VNPTTPVGDGDRKPTPTGRMIAGVATGRIRGFVATTGLNVVDVRDVARGHRLALELGEPGERYLLGGADLPLEELFAAVADLAGIPRPRVRVPYAVALAAGKAGMANSDEVKLARLPMYFSWQKARSRLGYAPGPVEPALARAVAEALSANGKGGA
jgi:dihydroflavonol-4-reductase